MRVAPFHKEYKKLLQSWLVLFADNLYGFYIMQNNVPNIVSFMQVGRGNARPALSLVGYDDELKVILSHMLSYYCNLVSLVEEMS